MRKAEGRRKLLRIMLDLEVLQVAHLGENLFTVVLVSVKEKKNC